MHRRSRQSGKTRQISSTVQEWESRNTVEQQTAGTPWKGRKINHFNDVNKNKAWTANPLLRTTNYEDLIIFNLNIIQC